MFRNKGSVYLCVSMFVAIVLVSGCQPTVPAKDIATSSIYPIMLLESTGDGTTSVSVELFVGGSNGTRISLDGEDKLVATFNNQSQQLEAKKNLLGVVSYVTRLDFDVPGTQITLTLERSDQTSDIVSNVEIPEGIKILEPVPGANFTHQDDITIVWEPSGDMNITIERVCEGGQPIQLTGNYVSNSNNLRDPNSWTYSISSLLGNDPNQNATCVLTMTLVRSVLGTLANEYIGGEISAQRDVSVSVNIIP